MPNSNHSTSQLLDSEKARLLVEAGGVVSATIKAQAGRWVVVLQTGRGGTVMLAKAKGGIRTWRDLARAAAYLRDALGVEAARLDMASW